MIALAVHPEYRNRGIGRHLFGLANDYLAEGAAAVGARQIELNVASTNAAARGLFESFGFFWSCPALIIPREVQVSGCVGTYLRVNFSPVEERNRTRL